MAVDVQRSPREGGADVVALMRAARREAGLDLRMVGAGEDDDGPDAYCAFVQGDVLVRIWRVCPVGLLCMCTCVLVGLLLRVGCMHVGA